MDLGLEQVGNLASCVFCSTIYMSSYFDAIHKPVVEKCQQHITSNSGTCGTPTRFCLPNALNLTSPP